MQRSRCERGACTRIPCRTTLVGTDLARRGPAPFHAPLVHAHGIGDSLRASVHGIARLRALAMCKPGATHKASSPTPAGWSKAGRKITSSLYGTDSAEDVLFDNFAERLVVFDRFKRKPVNRIKAVDRNKPVAIHHCDATRASPPLEIAQVSSLEPLSLRCSKCERRYTKI